MTPAPAARSFVPWVACVLWIVCFALATPALHAEDGYRLWLRYDLLADTAARESYRTALAGGIVLATPGGAPSPTLDAAQAELTAALRSLLDVTPALSLAGTAEFPAALPAAAPDAYAIQTAAVAPAGGAPAAPVTILARSDAGALYGAFALIRQIQLGQPLASTSAPRIQRRLLNHWDNLNRFVERGYAGFSLWDWFALPEVRTPRYRDYARALASVGLNGTVLTNVNADALVLTPPYLTKVAALADEFRPYGIRVYLTARFSAPMELGGLKTADPLDPAVIAWWRAKITEIYAAVPDFGGFLVKANSEGQPGPQNFGRTHADGANLLADALAPHGGIVMWRAFVYEPHPGQDRVKQAFSEFQPLDGQFRPNVVVQIKNGPLDFMPREPFSPLFGAMPRTPLALELQITQEYLGGAMQLAGLAPLFEEVLDADTFRPGPGSTIAQVIDGSLDSHALSVIAGVANIGTDRNWTGHPLAQANWYAFGRLAWDHQLSAAQISDEWTRLTFGPAPAVVRTITSMLLTSRETVVNYSMPLGLHHIMAEGHHYGPGPWAEASRPDWSSPYYHRAAPDGLGVDRTATGSDALEQYAPALARLWGDRATCPENLLLWFHHLPWDHRMASGRPLWDELALRYQQGVNEVRALQRAWETLANAIDAERFTDVRQRLMRQERDAREWRDACLLYFQQFAQRPLPAGVEPPEHPLSHYQSIRLRYAPGHPGDY